MINDPNELIAYIEPFFPHDPSLAIRAVSKLYPNIPMWIPEMIVFELFQIMGLKAAYNEVVSKFTEDGIIEGLSKELTLPDDLSNPPNPN